MTRDRSRTTLASLDAPDEGGSCNRPRTSHARGAGAASANAATPAAGWAGARPSPHGTRSRRLDLGSAKGQTMVEFALVLPILLVILFGIVQFGITFNHYVTLTDAVRAGARTAAVSRQVSCPVCVTTDKVKAASGDMAPDVAVTVTSTWQHGDDVVVKATVPYSINLMGLVVASGNLSSTTTERVE